MNTNISVKDLVYQAFDDAKLSLRDVDVRRYPDETIIVVRVDAAEMTAAIDVANRLDAVLEKREFAGFVTVKNADSALRSTQSAKRVTELSDQRVSDLVNLLTARSRTSELQPSLEYIADAKNHIAAANTARHHLIFGRRGSGKTALLAETKRLVERKKAFTIWVNIQTYRHEVGSRVFLFLGERFCHKIQAY